MKTVTPEKTLHSLLKRAQDSIYDKCGLALTNLRLNSESAEYGACNFELGGRKIEHRISKITPTKAGQFVTIWKRNKKGITEPFDIVDDFDFVLITSKDGDKFGQFIFPKDVLATKDVVSRNGTGGKRGIRVYPTWDKPTSKQAEKTQSWQSEYFLEIKVDCSPNIDLTKRLFNKTA